MVICAGAGRSLASKYLPSHLQIDALIGYCTSSPFEAEDLCVLATDIGSSSAAGVRYQVGWCFHAAICVGQMPYVTDDKVQYIKVIDRLVAVAEMSRNNRLLYSEACHRCSAAFF